MPTSPEDRGGIWISGNASGQFVVGDHNIAISGQRADVAGPGDLAELSALLDELRQVVAAQSGDTAAGLSKLGELEEAVIAETPDLATMEHVRGWFGRKMPGLSGAVSRIILSPIVSRLVVAAGDDLAAEFNRRFGH